MYPDKIEIKELDNISNVSNPAMKYTGAAVFMGIWLIIWGISEVFLSIIIYGFLRSGIHFQLFFIYLFYIFWTIVGCLVAYKFFWISCGKELVVISKADLKIKYSFCGIGFFRSFALKDIKQIKLSLTERKPHYDRSIKFGIKRFGNIEFEYQSKKYLFGVELNWADARTLINILEKYQSKLEHG